MQQLSDRTILTEKRFMRFGLVVVGILLVANMWLVYSLFFSAPGDPSLPRLSLNPISASAIIFSSGDTKQEHLPRTILILGRSGGEYIAPNLTDTIMLLHIAPSNTHTPASLISLPRDLLVQAVTDKKQSLKINALWAYSKHLYESGAIPNRTDFIKQRIGEIVGLSIDDVIIFDLATVATVVDTIGGVSVTVHEDIYDPFFPVATGITEVFELPAGQRYLDGARAVRFVRTRYSPQGDFDRIARQQELLRSIKGKVVSLSPVWNASTLWSLFSTVRNNIVTTLSPQDVRALWRFGQDISIDDIAVLSLTPETTELSPTSVFLGGAPAYVLVAKDSPFDYSTMQDRIRTFLSQ